MTTEAPAAPKAPPLPYAMTQKTKSAVKDEKNQNSGEKKVAEKKDDKLAQNINK